MHEAERGDAPIAIRSSRSNTVPEGADGFVPVSLASSPFVHDGFGLWLCARRLQQGHFMRPSMHRGERFELSMSQLQALAVGLPWERLDEHAKISIL